MHIRLLFFLLLFSLGSIAENTPDSLKKLLNNASDKEKIEVLNELNIYYRVNDPKTARLYSEAAYNISLKTNNISGAGKSLKNTALAYYFKGEYDSAVALTNKALLCFKEASDTVGMSGCFNNLGIFYKDLGSYPKALANYNLSLGIDERRNDKQGMASTLSNIGELHHLMGSYILALKYYTSSMQLEKENKNEEGIGDCLINIGALYEESQQFSKALDYYKKAIAIFTKSDNLQRLGICLNNTGWLLYEQSKYKEALNILNKALALRIKIDDKSGIATTYENIGKVYEAIGKSDEALEYFFKSVELNLEIGNKRKSASCLTSKGISLIKKKEYLKAIDFLNNSLEIVLCLSAKPEILENYKYLSEAYAKIKDFENAYKYSKLYAQLSDSLSKEQLATTETSIVSDSLENFRKLSNPESTESSKSGWIFTSGLVAIFVILLAGTVKKRRKRK